MEEFSRRGYGFVLVGERDGLAEALARVGVAVPDRIAPASAAELREFLARPSAGAARYSRPGMSSRPPSASVSTRQKVPVRSEASMSADPVAVT